MLFLSLQRGLGAFEFCAARLGRCGEPLGRFRIRRLPARRGLAHLARCGEMLRGGAPRHADDHAGLRERCLGQLGIGDEFRGAGSKQVLVSPPGLQRGLAARHRDISILETGGGPKDLEGTFGHQRITRMEREWCPRHCLTAMKIATYNVNGVNGRLPVLLRWLALAKPDVMVLQELKAPDDRFPEAAMRDAGYEAIWHGQSRWNGVAILSRVGAIHETRRGLPGDPDDEQSRYIEAAINGVLICGLYLPNGNPRPGPKFDFKLRWFQRLEVHLSGLLDLDAPVLCLGDFNVMPIDLDVYAPDRWRDDALFAPEVRAAYGRLLDQGWTDAVRHLHPHATIYTFWKYWRGAFERNAGLRIDHALLNPRAAALLVSADVDIRPRGWEKTSDHAPLCIELSDLPVGTGKVESRSRKRARAS